MKRIILTAVLIGASIGLMAQQQQPIKLPDSVTIKTTGVQFVQFDNTISSIREKIITSSMPSNQVQSIIADLNNSTKPFYDQANAQFDKFLSDTTKKSKKVKAVKPKAAGK